MFPAQQLKREQSLASCFSRADASCHGISNTWFACGFPSSSLTWPASQSGLQRLAREVRSDGSYMFDVDVNQVPPGYSQFDAALSAHPICESSRWRPGCRGHTTPRSKLGYRVHRSRRRKGRDNAGQFRLVHKGSSTVLLGAGFTATLESILEFIDRERMDSPMRSSCLQ